MSKIYIHHHLGLGDHIICNAMVRHYCKMYDEVVLFCKPNNLDNVMLMYTDLTNLRFMAGEDRDIFRYLGTNGIRNVIRVGFDQLDNSVNFDRSFYEQVGLDFSDKWEKFHMVRDHDREDSVYGELGLSDQEPYIFVHDDHSRGYPVDDGLLPEGIRVVRPEMRYGLFDYCKVIECASELHLMESSYKCLVEHIDIRTERLFYHTYVRNYPPNIRVSSKYNWTEIKKEEGEGEGK